MNWLLIVSGSVALFTTVGHFAIGSKQFLRPMLESSFDAVAKKVMHCVFHYISTFLILSTVALLFAGFNPDMSDDFRPLVRFVSLNYGAFAAWQIILACTSGIPKGAVKMFQWIFFVVIAVTGWMGS